MACERKGRPPGGRWSIKRARGTSMPWREGQIDFKLGIKQGIKASERQDRVQLAAPATSRAAPAAGWARRLPPLAS